MIAATERVMSEADRAIRGAEQDVLLLLGRLLEGDPEVPAALVPAMDALRELRVRREALLQLMHAAEKCVAAGKLDALAGLEITAALGRLSAA